MLSWERTILNFLMGPIVSRGTALPRSDAPTGRGTVTTARPSAVTSFCASVGVPVWDGYCSILDALGALDAALTCAGTATLMWC